MISAIGSGNFASPVGGGNSSAGLETQLAQYQVKLADWVNCPSCKTAEGKAKIAEISGKIDDIQQRLKAADAAKQRGRQSAVAANPPFEGNAKKALSASSANDKPGYGAILSPSASLSIGVVGSRLDVFA